MAESIVSFNSTEVRSIDSTAQRFFNPEEFKPSQIKKFYKKFLVVCSSVFANNNPQNKLSTREIRQRFQQGSIEKPSFEEWFKNKCFIIWDKEAKKLTLENENGLHSQEVRSPILSDISMIEGPLETNFEEYSEELNQNIQNNLEEVPLIEAPTGINLSEVIIEQQRTQSETSIDSEGSKTPINSEEWTNQENTIDNNGKRNSIPLTKKKKLSKKKNIHKKVIFRNLAQSYKDLTGANIEDTSFKVDNVIGHKFNSSRNKLELKIQWAPDKKRRVKYKPTYESASLCSCSTAVRQYSKKVYQKYQKIKKRAYFEKKFDISKATNEALEISDSFFDKLGKKSKKY